jgi:hypothetical protein
VPVPIANTRLGKAYDEIFAGGHPDIERRWIGRCKKCGATHKIEGRVMEGRRGKQVDLVIRAHDGSVYITADNGSNSSEVVVPCGDHWCRLKCVMEGTKKSKHACGARCTNATGPQCDCRCKGKNHGSNC